MQQEKACNKRRHATGQTCNSGKHQKYANSKNRYDVTPDIESYHIISDSRQSVQDFEFFKININGSVAATDFRHISFRNF